MAVFYEVLKSNLGFLLVCVCAAKKTETSRGCWIHGATDRRNYGERIAQELRIYGIKQRSCGLTEIRIHGKHFVGYYGLTELRKQASLELRIRESTESRSVFRNVE